MRTRVGIHAPNKAELNEADINAIAEMRLETIKFMSNVGSDSLYRVKEILPDKAPILVRLYVLQDKYFQPGNGSDCPPTEYADNAILQMAIFRDVFGEENLYFQIQNEPNHQAGYEGWGDGEEDAKSFNDWYISTFTELKKLTPWATIGFPGLAVPHGPYPDLDLTWAEICRNAIELSDFLSVHCYWQNFEPEHENHLNDFWGLRYRRYHQLFPTKPLFIAESGNSNAQGGYTLNPDIYASETGSWYQALWADEYLIGANPFILSSNDENWESFTYIDQSETPKPVACAVRDMYRPPLRGDETMPSLTPFVDDQRTNEQITDNLPRLYTWDDLQQYFKCDIRRDMGWDITPEGKACWFLEGFYIRSGAATYITKVQKENGQPFPDILVYRHWPDAPELPHVPHPNYHPNAVAGFTNGSGDAGSPYGGGSVVGGDGGPDDIWVSSSPPPQEPQRSDMAIKLGWFGGTDHVTPNPIFRYVTKQNGQPVPTLGDARIEIIINGERMGYMPIFTGTKPPDWNAYQQVIDDDGNTLGFMKIEQD